MIGMREDLLCEVQGRIVTKNNKPLRGKHAWVEFLPVTPMFRADGVDYCPIGFKARLDENGAFRGLLTRSDLTRISYITYGACGHYVIDLTGPGPHLLSELLKTARKPEWMTHDS
jgi:hypothetical protein